MPAFPEMRLEDKLLREKIKRLIDRLYDEQDIEHMHEAAHMLIDLMFKHKLAMYYFQQEAVNNLASENRWV